MTDQVTVAPPVPTMALAGISKSFGGVVALADVDLEVRPGEIHALLGENGAGKSTLMAVACGALAPDHGSISVANRTLDRLTPATATEFGVAIVHQHPAVMPDLTVAENIRVAVPARHLTHPDGVGAAMRAMLDDVGFRPHLEDRVSSLTIAQKHLLELAKALVVDPRLLILDEPTAPLGQESVELLFDRVRAAARAGTAIVYITHRLAEVRALADRVTVLRDGTVRGTQAVEDISDDQLLAMIVGRKLESAFPPKVRPDDDGEVRLVVDGLSGDGFDDISFTARRGEIIGISGIVGNGQSPLLRALAGLTSFTGTVQVGGKAFEARHLRRRSGYLPADRHSEGLMMSMSVRENAALSSLPQFRGSGLLRRGPEHAAVDHELQELAVKTSSREAVVSSLSGGNQQKVVLARALMSQPAILVADEPTQGVDVGARTEIYRLLREIAAAGTPVVIASSDAMELAGLCDRVVVMSRGSQEATFAGAEITEEALVHAAVQATAQRRESRPEKASRSTPLRRFVSGDYAPVVILAVVMLALGGYVLSRNSLYLSQFNLTALMMSCAALGFIALGQTVALILGGIDLSVGPLAGLMVVVGSFFLTQGKSAGAVVLGLVLMLVCGVGTGAVNGSLIRYARFTPVAATLATYIGLQGVSFLLRDTSGGSISVAVTDVVKKTVGPVPVSFIVLVVVAVALELVLRLRPAGRALRAVGSTEDAARKVGIRVDRTALCGYVLCSLLVFLGAVVLLGQLGIGDPSQGVSYTLSSITAVVLGGTSLLGGRGTFIGTLLGAGLVVQVLNATVFLDLSQTWQYFFQGALVVAAAVVYSRVRGTRSIFG